MDPTKVVRRPTLADVAAVAGVSRATASRALTEGASVSPAARARVWAAAEQLRFEPNQLARSLRRGSTMGVGIAVPDVAIAFFATALKGAQETLEARGHHVLVVNTERSAVRERLALRTLRSHRVDGLIVATSGGYEDIGVPAVFFDNVPSGVSAGAVALENAGGIALLVEHLARHHGLRRIAYVGPPEAGGEEYRHTTARERLEGFRAAMGRTGLAVPPDYVRASDIDSTPASAAAIAVELARLPEPPEAIIGGADTLAVGVLQGLRSVGLRVPDDIALVSFDEPSHAEVLDPAVTSLDRHDRELGNRAAELLLDALHDAGGRPAEAAVERVPLKLCVRRSCGCRA
jgi:DNA-binding LacI/PurR family transcriptional regulator